MKNSLAGFIVAGGRGSRMGGVDKGLMPLQGRPLVAWMCDRLEPQVDALFIVANRNLEAYRALGHPVVRNIRGGFLGPLAGFEAALSATPRNWIVTAPVDAPMLPPHYAERMLSLSKGKPAVAVIGAQLQPLYALLPRQALPGLRAYLAAGGRKASTWLESLGAVHVDFEPWAESFTDADTPEQLAELSAQMSGALKTDV